MSLPASDNFTGTDGQTLHTHLASWTDGSNNSCNISTNKAQCSFNGAGFWTGDTFSTDHYSQCVLDSTTRGGPCVRGASDTYYYLFVDEQVGTGNRITKRVAGSETTLLSVNPITNTHTVKLTVSGTTLEAFDNGVSLGSVTDSAISTGSPGVAGTSGGTVDDWIADNLVAVSTSFKSKNALRPRPFAPGLAR